MERTSRRGYLLAGGSLAAALAGCVGRTDPADRSRTTSTAPGTTTGTPQATTDDPTTTTGTGTGTPDGVAWRREVGGSVTALVPGTDAGYAGTKAGDVFALDGDGGERWSVTFDSPIPGIEPSGDLALVVVGASELFASHRVVALDAASGERRWEFAPEEWWLDALGTRDGIVYVATSNDAIAEDGQTLYALSRADGGERWSGEVGDNSGSLVTGDAVYVPSFGRIYAYGHDGTRRWSLDVSEYGHNSLAAAGGTVAFAGVEATDDRRRQSAIGLSPADGSVEWTVGGWFVTSLVGHDGRLFAGGERVVDVDPATGETGWRFDPGGSIYDAPIADGALFTSGPVVHAVSLADGTGRWSFEPDLHLLDPAAVVGDSVYVHASKSQDDRNRHVIALDASDGSERWRFAAGSRLSSPVVVGGRVVAGSDDGAVYGFD